MKHSGIAADRWNPRVQAQIAAQLEQDAARRGAKLQPIPESPPTQQRALAGQETGKAMLRQDRGGLNKTEAAFDAHLRANAMRPLREGLTLRLGNGVRYSPDFVVITDATNGHAVPVCEIRCYEVKGFMRDDAAVKVKVAASLFPLFAFYLVTKRTKKQGGGWSIERVLP